MKGKIANVNVAYYINLDTVRAVEQAVGVQLIGRKSTRVHMMTHSLCFFFYLNKYIFPKLIYQKLKKKNVTVKIYVYLTDHIGPKSKGACFSQLVTKFKTMPFVFCVLFQYHAVFKSNHISDNDILIRGTTLAAVQLEPRISFNIFLSTNSTASQVALKSIQSETECFIAWHFKSQCQQLF